MTRAKKPTLTEQIADLKRVIECRNDMLSRRFIEVSEFIGREQEICVTLGRKAGESLLVCAERVAAERSELSSKVRSFKAEIEQAAQQRERDVLELGKLRGRLDVILAVAEI